MRGYFLQVLSTAAVGGIYRWQGVDNRVGMFLGQAPV